MRAGALPWPATREQSVRWAVGLVIVLAAGLGLRDGGFEASSWAPAGIVLLWMAAAGWWWARPGRIPRTVGVTLVAYAALTLWTAASIVWADTPARALETTGRTVVYGAALTLVVLPRWPRESVRRLLVLVAAAATGLALVTLARVVLADDPSRFFIDGRLVAPAGYVNAAAALWVVALPVLLVLAGGAVRHPAARVAALTAAGLVLQLGLWSQSRGALLAIAAVVVMLLAASPQRGAVALATGVAAIAAALAAPAILEVRGAADAVTLGLRIDRATSRMLIGLVALTVAGAAWQLLLVRAARSRRATVLHDPRWGNRAVVALALVAALGVVAAVGNPVGWASGKVDEALHGGYDAVAPTGDRLTGSLGSGRGDMYRVAMDAWRDRPWTGTGGGDFQAAYLADRRTDNSPRYAHSLPLGVLSGLGLVGALLALTVALALAAAVLGRWRAMSAATRTVVAAPIAAFVGWLVQAGWDWTWEFPALTIVALVLLGVAARATDDAGAVPSPELRAIQERARQHGVAVPADPDGPRPRSGGPSRWRTRFGGSVLLVGVLALTVAFAAIGLSSHLFARGTATAAVDPVAAASDLSRAARLNPFDGDATLSRAIVVRRLGDVPGWEAELRRTIARAPHDWLAQLELAIAEVQDPARRGAGFARLRLARDLNPRQPVIAPVIAALRRGDAVDPGAVEAQLAGRHAELVRPIAGG